ncbi:unnamed protein product [Amoebophrya sp. A120]|nr:unnamed protein product [Amoebophrya sp. A120]|eukprot:GSA120T00006013001.1
MSACSGSLVVSFCRAAGWVPRRWLHSEAVQSQWVVQARVEAANPMTANPMTAINWCRRDFNTETTKRERGVGQPSCFVMEFQKIPGSQFSQKKVQTRTPTRRGHGAIISTVLNKTVVFIFSARSIYKVKRMVMVLFTLFTQCWFLLFTLVLIFTLVLLLALTLVLPQHPFRNIHTKLFLLLSQQTT